ncbi:MAG: hypothetical protein ACRDYC_09145 [Acidimicrobiales bacterium]
MESIPLTVLEAAAALRDGSITSIDLTEALLARADALDPQTGTSSPASMNMP